MSLARAWPALLEEDGWVLELMKERLESSEQTPDELRARAKELRSEAAASDIKGVQDAALALADHYDGAAVARAASM